MVKVLLRRDLFIGGVKYEADPAGTDLPDVVEGKKLVFAADPYVEADKELKLPWDAVPWTEEASKKAPPPRQLLRNAGEPPPQTALSELIEHRRDPQHGTTDHRTGIQKSDKTEFGKK